MITEEALNGLTHDFSEFTKKHNLPAGNVGFLMGIVMKNLKVTKVKCKSYCTYSKAMNQVFPRKCIKCGEPEPDATNG